MITTTATDSTTGPLSHIRVLDFTQLLQGPLATQILADMGADVVKVEKPGGEWMRHWGILASETAGEMDSFLAFNRNKRSVSVDLKDPEVRTAILNASAHFDVVVENFRPGVMRKLGLDYEDFRQANPKIIYASSSGYGQDGPYSKRPGQDLLVQAIAGALQLTGRRSDPPTPAGIGISDEYTGMHLTTAILAALLSRTVTGEGQRLSVDLFSCTIAAQQQELTVYLNHGNPLLRAERGIGHVGGTSPFGVYPTADGYLALAMTPCPVLAEVLGEPWLAQYDTNELMFIHRDTIHAHLSEVLVTRSTSEWLSILEPADVWCARVQDYAEVERDPQVAHNDLIWTVPVGTAGEEFRTIGTPFRFSRTPITLRRGVPRSGQDNAELLAEWGLSADHAK